MTIADDGTGFDSAIVAQYVADGHIGLGSLLARFDAMGGAMDINSQIGYGTQVMRRRRRSRRRSRELGPQQVGNVNSARFAACVRDSASLVQLTVSRGR